MEGVGFLASSLLRIRLSSFSSRAEVSVSSLNRFSFTLRLCLLLGATAAGLCCGASSSTQPAAPSAAGSPEIADARVTFLAVGDIALASRGAAHERG